MASIKGNIVLNSINTVTGIIFPIITFPYAARVLLPDGIGIVNFQLSLINYIVLFTGLGIPLYAVKEIAKYQNDITLRNTVAAEILTLSVVLCIIGYLFVWLIAQFVPQVHSYQSLFYILSLTILFTAIGVNWFYQGIEDFKFITVRAIIIRCLSATLLFLFVKSPDDLLIYGLVVVGSTVGNNLINFIHLRKYLKSNYISKNLSRVLRHLKPSLSAFTFYVLASIYLYINTTMLGFMTNDNIVGLFTAGTKIPTIGLTLIGSIGVVLLPRSVNMLEEGKKLEFRQLSIKSIESTLAIALPISLGTFLLAEPLICIFCGYSYLNSIQILYWNSPIILITGIINLIGSQILYPKGCIRLMIISKAIGLVTNIILNLFLIPKLNAIGAAISILISEILSLIVILLIGNKKIPYHIFDLRIKNYLVASLLMGIFIIGMELCVENQITKLILCFTGGVAIYSTYLYSRNDGFIRLCLDMLHLK